MTTINLHGILAEEFGACFQIAIRNAKETIEAISANKQNFRHRMMELAKSGINYTIIVDGYHIKKIQELNFKNPKEIDLVPAIMGAGGARKIIGAILTVVGIVLMFTPFAPLGAVLISTGVTLMMTKETKTDPISSYTSAAKESLVFSSKANITQQGVPVPVGYGRLRVGSVVIQSSIKSYSMKQISDKALVGDNEDNSISLSSKYSR